MSAAPNPATLKFLPGQAVLDLGTAELIEADGCWLATGGPEGMVPARRLLDPYEALPLRTALERLQRRAV